MGVDLMMVGVHQVVHQEMHQEGRPEVWRQRLLPPRVTGRLRPRHPPHRPRQPRRPHRLHLGLRNLWGMDSGECLSGNLMTIDIDFSQEDLGAQSGAGGRRHLFHHPSPPPRRLRRHCGRLRGGGGRRGAGSRPRRTGEQRASPGWPPPPSTSTTVLVWTRTSMHPELPPRMKIRSSLVLLFDRWCKVYGFLVLFQTGSNCHKPLQGVYKFAFL